jgi:glutamyl-tRNA reductase
VTNHPVRLLAIDLRKTVPAVRQALVLNAAEVRELLRRASAEHEGVELVIVSCAQRFELYSTEAGHAAAFRCVLRELVSRAGGAEKLGALPTIEATGVTAAQHLLGHAAGIGGHSGLEILVELNVAVARSRAAGTLGSELSLLFASAVQAGWRAYCETSVGDPSKSQPEREIAILEAERIIEEELVVWKAKRESQRPAAPEPSFYRRYGTTCVPGRLRPSASPQV